MNRTLPFLAFALLGSTSPGFAQYQYAPAPDYYRNDTAERTVVGGGFGAIAGALIGGGKGKSTEGALIGAATGALAGNLLGRSKDTADRQHAAAGYAATAGANARATALAVTNYDLIQMTRAGLDDSLILGAIQSRGGRFDLSPAGLISLKDHGVSDRVVIAAQQTASVGGIITPPPAPAPVVIEPPPVHYYYHPAPRHVYYHPPRPAGFHVHYRHRW